MGDDGKSLGRASRAADKGVIAINLFPISISDLSLDNLPKYLRALKSRGLAQHSKPRRSDSIGDASDTIYSQCQTRNI